jgi:hypothetical protein
MHNPHPDTLRVFASGFVPEGYEYRNAMVTDTNGPEPLFSFDGSRQVSDAWQVHFGTAQGAYFGCVEVIISEENEWAGEWFPFTCEDF